VPEIPLALRQHYRIEWRGYADVVMEKFQGVRE
jgi:hypothetical protein